MGLKSLSKRLSSSPQETTQVRKNTVKPKEVTSKLTGVVISPELNNRPVTAIMIENSPDARPQSGLYDAGVVYEAIAEGGITRFTTLFLESQPSNIGPVRSARPYYLDWIMPFDAAIVHAGGSAVALADIKSLGIKDLDHGANGQAFRRVSNRAAPHNLYTSMAEIDKLQQAKGFTSNFTGFPRKKDAPSATPNVKSIDFDISGELYKSHLDYDAASNSYLRSEAGRSHIDETTGKQLNPKVVIALIINWSQSGIYSVYQTTGSGKILVFQDGTVTEGTWSKAGRKDQIMFTDAAGQPLKLNAGQTWITALADAGRVKYQ